MNTFRFPPSPTLPTTPATALASAVVQHHAPGILQRGGPVQRAANIFARTDDLLYAVNEAAKQGKGHIAEVQQAATYNVASGVQLREYHARPSPRANDPQIDVQVRSARRFRTGAQLKVGSPQYVRRAAAESTAPILVVNREARDVLLSRGELDPEILDHLSYAALDADAVSAEECHRVAADSMQRVLSGETRIVDTLAQAVRAGGCAALEGFAFRMVEELLGALAGNVTFNVLSAAEVSLHAGARAGSKAAVQSYLLVRQFVARARKQFSDRLIHRIARSTYWLGAVAEVIVETAIDLFAVVTGKLTFEELLRRFGVHVFTAGGAAAGMALAALLTGGMSAWFQLGAILLGGYVGGRYGRVIGERVFIPAHIGHPALGS